MANENDMTLAGYNISVAEYIAKSPQAVTPELKEWIDVNLSELPENPMILEIGSGSGKDAKYIMSQDFKLELTDACQGFVDYLNSQGMKARLLNILTGDLDEKYDMIFADAVFLHFTPEQLRMVLQKVSGSLKKGGRVAFSLKVGRGDEISERKLNVPRYFCYWTSQDIIRLLEDIGFLRINKLNTDD